MIQHFDNLFKVVKAGAKTSALLNVSPAAVNYNSGKNFVAPTLDGTPFLVFTSIESAFAFADKFEDKQVFEVEAYGETVPVARALRIKVAGWERNAVQFWADILAGRPLDRYDTIETMDNSVALFGVMRLGKPATRPVKLAAPAPIAAAPKRWQGW